MKIIKFYQTNEEYGCFSNFADYPIELKGKSWPTSEHYFQAQKFVGTKHEEEIIKINSPMMAAQLGRDRKKPLRRDWEKVKDSIMRDAVLATGDAKIIEHTENDRYWGDGGDGKGQNKLGRILMSVRSELCPIIEED
ncbi:NADAR family protein [Chamaesiphon sp. VAR_48_metabat_403]|uniref:NADAR family protein n=1 Tax=Chamaesiphon sp. VAR_48_metabat_403 TaxID=2964700 RepID=UPI00286DAF38|nr:NADAR family protein [Chamaesiphon sp. VAR_48_metabat_403]